MSYQRRAYDDQDTLGQMTTDCHACSTQMGLVERQMTGHTAGPITGQAPSLLFEDYPAEIRKPEISISDAAAHLASRLHLHLD